MIIWINGAFGAGKTTTAFELCRRLPNSFVYDPENVGYFIRKNSPRLFSAGDFQDIPLWRETNYKMLKMIAGQYDGTIIAPMTLVNPHYFDEIIGALRRDGIDVQHYILYASRETLLKRLRLRSIRMLGSESFALRSIDRCLHSFDNLITE
ncbi:MAG: AAA family ATPase, partial [Bacillota bacterium]